MNNKVFVNITSIIIVISIMIFIKKYIYIDKSILLFNNFSNLITGVEENNIKKIDSLLENTIISNGIEEKYYNDYFNVVISSYNTIKENDFNKWNTYINGWTNRTHDTLELYFYGDYMRTH